MIKQIVLGMFAAFALAGCGSGSKATGPSAPIILICNEDVANDSRSDSTSNTTVTNDCNKPITNVPPVEEPAV